MVQIEAKRVNFFVGPAIVTEDNARGAINYLIHRAGHQLDIASKTLNSSVWDESVAKLLQRTLDRKPQLKVRIMTGPELIGNEENRHHPFYETLSRQRERVSFAIHGNLPVEGVRADEQLIRKIGSSNEELITALAYYPIYDGAEVMGKIDAFRRGFERLWDEADKYPNIPYIR